VPTTLIYDRGVIKRDALTTAGYRPRPAHLPRGHVRRQLSTALEFQPPLPSETQAKAPILIILCLESPAEGAVPVQNDGSGTSQPARTYLYGRRMYEAMLNWETAHTTVQPRLFQEFTGIWQAAEKIVFSKTLASVSSARTRVEPAFEPGLVRQLKSAAEHDMRVGGADLAGQAIKAGLADEVRLFLVPVVVGGGKRALPDGVRSDLELLDTQRFASGAVYLRYCLQSA